MKKSSLLLLALVWMQTVHAQGSRLRVGPVLGFTSSWISIQTREIERSGIGSGLTIGVGGTQPINDNLAIASGIQFDIESFAVNYGEQVTGSRPSGTVFYGYDDTDILKYRHEEGSADKNPIENLTDTSNVLELLSRKYKGRYVTIPVFLKFQTDPIGTLKYYGKFGLRTSILMSVRMDDTGYDAAYSPANDRFVRTGTTAHTLNKKMKPVTFLKGLTPIRVAIGFYGGAAWNFVGSTLLIGEIGFNYGLTPSMQMESDHLVNQKTSGGAVHRSALEIKNNPQHMIEFKVGLLF